MDKLKMHSPDFVEANIAQVASLFPGCVTEAAREDGSPKRAIDFDLLRQELSPAIVEGPRERYHLNWPGKQAAFLAANIPVTKALRPCREESVDFDATENLFIEGDNLDALKVLQNSYLGKVKMIYIDPPYNTGRDFIYKDRFAMKDGEWKMANGEYAGNGDRLVANPESNGRFHSDWLSMMYPRLKLARNLLADDGVVLISIDDNEVSNLRSVCDQIFGEGNFINSFCHVNNLKGRQTTNVGAAGTYEHVLAYARNFDGVGQWEIDVKMATAMMPNVYRMKDYGVSHDEHGEYTVKNELHNTNKEFNEKTRPSLVFNIHFNPDSEEVKFSEVNEMAEFPGFVKVPPKKINGGSNQYRAWRWSKEKILREQHNLLFRKDKAGSYRIYTKIRDFEKTNLKNLILGMTSGSNALSKLGIEFSNPKSVELIRVLLNAVADSDSIVVDLFSGSATTAHAVMQANAEDGGKRKFIMMQLSEACNEASEAFRAGYKTIAEIGKERIRRAGRKIKEDNGLAAPGLDIGFRVLKIDSSNMQDVYYNGDESTQDMLSSTIEGIKQDRTAEDLLFQVMHDCGISLTAPIVRETIHGLDVFSVNGNDLVACLANDGEISREFGKEIARRKPLRLVCRDSGFKDDCAMDNLEKIFEVMSPHTELNFL